MKKFISLSPTKEMEKDEEPSSCTPNPKSDPNLDSKNKLFSLRPNIQSSNMKNFENNSELLNDIYQQLKRTYSEKYCHQQNIEFQNPPHWVSKPSISKSQAQTWNVKSNNAFYNRKTVVQRYSMRADTILCSLTFNQDGSCFAYADCHNVFLLRSEDGSLINAWEIPSSVAKSNLQTRVLEFSSNSKFLALGVSTDTIMLISIGSESEPIILKGHIGQVTSLLFLQSDTNILISGGYDGYLCFWDLENKSLTKIIKHRSEQNAANRANVEGKIVALAEPSDNQYVAVGFMDGIVGIYEKTFTKEMMKFTAHDQYLFDLAISKSSGLLATASADFSVRLWNLNAVAECQKTLLGHNNIVMTICFSDLDSIIFTGSKDEMMIGWEIETGEQLFTIEFHENTVFKISHHPKARSFLSCSGDGMISMWDYSLPEKI